MRGGVRSRGRFPIEPTLERNTEIRVKYKAFALLIEITCILISSKDAATFFFFTFCKVCCEKDSHAWSRNLIIVHHKQKPSYKTQ